MVLNDQSFVMGLDHKPLTMGLMPKESLCHFYCEGTPTGTIYKPGNQICHSPKLVKPQN
jgi:hypothetical protein